MPNITINEISQNYTYNVGTSTFATIAIPMTASWGPAFTQGNIYDTQASAAVLAMSDTSKAITQKLDDVPWTRFPSSQAGMESFIRTYRGPAANYKSAKDYSFQVALTYLASGYDVLVCRVASGAQAQVSQATTSSSVVFKAKYQGTFGNSLVVIFKSVPLTKISNVQYYYYNALVYIKDANSGAMTAVENLNFVFDQTYESTNIPYFEEVNSEFIYIEKPSGVIPATESISSVTLNLTGGKDCFDVPAAADIGATLGTAVASYGATYFAGLRYSLSSVIAGGTGDQLPAQASGDDPAVTSPHDYVNKLFAMSYDSNYKPTDPSVANILRCNEYNYLAAFICYTFLMDKLNYDPQRIAAPGWDDQNYTVLNFNRSAFTGRITEVSPLHRKIMEVSCYSRCACGMLDVPFSCPRKYVSDASDSTALGYAQLLSEDRLGSSYLDADGALYPTHVALFAPWGKYRFVNAEKELTAPPSFLAMLIQRAMILNQPTQYEWILPSTRTHTLRIGELAYKTPKHILDAWQASSGVSVNVITEIPGQGTTVWGNATLFNVPPATYNALQNLSTRYLINAVKDVVYRCGIGITFQYNNQQAYSKFYAGVSPTLDTMRSAGAIDDYLITMSADINGMDQVNANSVIGKVVLIVNGVITDITVDLIALPPGSDLTQFAQ